MDIATPDKWGAYTAAKEVTFRFTDADIVPWTMVKSNDKKRLRITAMRYVLSLFDYENKDLAVVGRPDPLVAGRASDVIGE